MGPHQTIDTVYTNAVKRMINQFLQTYSDTRIIEDNINKCACRSIIWLNTQIQMAPYPSTLRPKSNDASVQLYFSFSFFIMRLV